MLGLEAGSRQCGGTAALLVDSVGGSLPIYLKNACRVFCEDTVRFDILLSGKHPEFLGYPVYMPNFNIIFNAVIALVSV